MKMVKRVVSVTLVLMFMMSTVSFAVTSSGTADTITMYAPDGRSIVVSPFEVWKWQDVGWYDYPVTTMYAPDGRQAVVYTGEVDSWKSVGWYDYPVTTMYAPDGRQVVIFSGDVEAWKSVGWYDHPVDTNTGSYNSGSYYGYGRSGSYYPNTNVPDYTAVTGVGLKYVHNGDGVTIYIYPNTQYGEYYEVVDYIAYLEYDAGWSLFNENYEDDSITWYYTKNRDLVGVTYQTEFDEIWIVVGN